MKTFIDLHQDLFLHIHHPELFPKKDQTSFEMIKEYNLKIVTVSAFPAPKDNDQFNASVPHMIESDLRAYVEYTNNHPEFVVIKTKDDVRKVLATEGLYGLLLHVEGLNVFDRNDGWDMLERWYSIGLRSIGPVWNHDNDFGGGDAGSSEVGLSGLGASLVKWCEENGVLFDFAHMNEKTFWDASKIVTRPILVSHGNARALCDSPRNLNDAQLKAVGASSGVVGVFFSKKFLSSEKMIDHAVVLEHMSHISSAAGDAALALGSDFGGIISGFPEGVDSVAHLPSLLSKVPSDKQDLFSYKNALRVLEAHLL